MVFSVSVVDLINILFIAAGIGICGLCFLQITSSIHLRKEIRSYFQLFFTLILVYITTHLARQVLSGIPGDGIRTTLYTVTFIEMITAGFMAYMMSMLVVAVSKVQKNTKVLNVVLLVLFCIHALILIIGSIFDFIYLFDTGNVYHRGTGYILSNFSPFVMLVIDMVLLIICRKKIDKRVKMAFWIYLIAPVAAILVQSIFFGIQFIIFATVGAAVFMFSVIIKVQNEKYEKQQLERSKIKTELTLATRIQANMLPNIFPAFPDRPEFDIYASMDPAKEVGGDFYDFFLIDEDHLCLVMADVSGKGVPAALFMMAAKIILANYAKMGKSPAEILTSANASICSSNREDMFVTVWLGILELSTGKLTAANAGHEYPVLRQPDGNFELYKDKHGFVIGGMEGLKYKEYSINMKPGAKIFLYTDGVPEATDSEDQLFGTERMVAALNKNPESSPQEILKSVRSSVDDFVKNAEQFDDLTMLCMEYKKQL